MAYVPVTQSKKTSGYVPVSKKTPTLPDVLSTQLPTQQLIRDISKPAPAPQKPQSIDERNAETKRLTGSVPFAATKTGIAVNTVLGLPKAALDVVREIPRGITGTAAQGTAFALGMDQKDVSVQPKGFAQRLFLGDKPIEPAKEGADLLKLVGINEKTASKLGPILYAGLTLSDFVSVPGKKKGLIEAAKLALDTKQAKVVLKNAGITDDVVKAFKLDEKVVAAKTDAEVEQIFKDIPKEVVKQTAPLPKLPDQTTPPRVDTMNVVKTAPVSRAPSSLKTLNLEKSPDPVATAARAANVDDVQLQDSLNRLQQWVSGGARTILDVPTLKNIDSLNIKPTEKITLYRTGDIDGTQFQSWSKEKPTFMDGVTTKEFTPEEILVDTTSPELRALYRDDPQAQEVFQRDRKSVV
jgi:hypothetical protein